MKKVITSLIVAGLSISTIGVFAETVSGTDINVPSVPMVDSVRATVENTETLQGKSLRWVKLKSSLLIKERINSLNANATIIAKSQKLTTEQKAAFATFFSGKVTELTALGVKIASSTDATSTKTLTASIFTDFRIYGIVLPQVRLEKRIYELQNHGVSLTEVFAKVQKAIDAQKARGKDVSVWQANLDATKTLVVKDTEKLSLLLTQISSLKPSDYGTTSKATIESVNSGVRSIAKDFQSVRGKLRRPEILKNMTATTTAAGITTTTTVAATTTAIDTTATTTTTGGAVTNTNSSTPR
jgi:hypothetical protein